MEEGNHYSLSTGEQCFKTFCFNFCCDEVYGKVYCKQLKLEVGPQLDLYQLAYKHRRGNDDAIISQVHLVTKHLETPRGYARLLFVDFSSAFNTLQPHSSE